MSTSVEEPTKSLSKISLVEKKEPNINELSSYLKKFRYRRGKADKNVKVGKLLPEIKEVIRVNFIPKNISHASENLDRLDQAEIITQENILEYLIKQVIIHRLDIQGMEISQLLDLFRTKAGSKKRQREKAKRKEITKEQKKLITQYLIKKYGRKKWGEDKDSEIGEDYVRLLNNPPKISKTKKRTKKKKTKKKKTKKKKTKKKNKK